MNQARYLVLASVCLLWIAPVLFAESTGQSFQGAVELAALTNGEIHLALDERDAEGVTDGVADHLFVLQLDDSKEIKALSLADAIVTHAPGRLTLRYGSDQVLRWRLIPADRSHKSVRDPNIFFGDGLSHHTGPFEISPVELAREDSVDDLSEEVLSFTPDGGGGVTCDSGGVGAERCSILCVKGNRKQCSVQCAENSSKFACCNCLSGGASCKCWTLQSY